LIGLVLLIGVQFHLVRSFHFRPLSRFNILKEMAPPLFSVQQRRAFVSWSLRAPPMYIFSPFFTHFSFGTDDSEFVFEPLPTTPDFCFVLEVFFPTLLYPNWFLGSFFLWRGLRVTTVLRTYSSPARAPFLRSVILGFFYGQFPS